MVEYSYASRLIGVWCGNYQVEQFIEQHPWGPTFLARARTGKQYLLRFIGDPALAEHVALTPQARIIFLGRLQQEANQIAALRHAHILPLLDYGYFQGMPYLVYPAVKPVTLRAVLRKQGQTDLYSVGRYLEQLAGALEYGHEQAVLHRNLSTQCIYVHQNRLLIAEFGLLRMVELSRQVIVSRDEVEEGSAQWRSFDGSSESSAPEQLLGKPSDTYTDTYALGAVLYRLLSGHPPFEGKTREEIARQHLYAQVPLLSTWRAGLPAELDHSIRKAMAKDAMQRFQRPGELVQAYQQIISPDPNGTSRNMLVTTTGGLPRITRQLVEEMLETTERTSTQPPRKVRHRLATSRRRFLVLAGSTVVGLTATAVFVSTRLIRAPVAAKHGSVLAHVAEMPINTALNFPLAHQVRPGVLIRLSEQQFVAFDTTCTHKGCQVVYHPDRHRLECPCHAAIFDPANNAAVVQGPAPKPLTAVPIVINADGTITAK